MSVSNRVLAGGFLLAILQIQSAMSFSVPSSVGLSQFMGTKNSASVDVLGRQTAKRMAAPFSVCMTLKTEGIQRPKEVNIGNPLPRLYVYDHCPFCVRVRAIFGFKNIKHEVRFLANDDVFTPTNLVGKKVAPILEIPSKNEIMKESLDIVKRIDEDPTFGPVLLKPSTGRKDLNEWENKHKDIFRLLQRPRYVSTGLIPEFAMKAGRDAFVKNHPVPPYEKDEWKDESKFDMPKRYAMYTEAMGQTAQLLTKANEAVQELDPLIYSAKHCSEGGLGYDDIELFGRLRSLTIIKGLVLPPKVAGYLEYMSAKADIPLYWQLAV